MMEEVSCTSVNTHNRGGSSTGHGAELEQNEGLYASQTLESRDGEDSPEQRCVALRLPREVSRRVFSQLDYRDLVQCSLVCKDWHLEATELRQGWKLYWKNCVWLDGYRQWHLELTELRQGWKEELFWESCSIRGVHFHMNEPLSSHPPSLALYFAGSLD